MILTPNFQKRYLRRQVNIATAITPIIMVIRIYVRNSAAICIENLEFLIKEHAALLGTLLLLKSQGKSLKAL